VHVRTTGQSGFNQAKTKLAKMHAERRPPEDFTRFRAVNQELIKNLEDEFGHWFGKLTESIRRGERGEYEDA
jgi:hypothetical protein